ATPNYTIGVLDPAGPDFFTRTVSSTFPNRVYNASTIARDAGIDYFTSIDKNYELFSPVGTDAFTFNNAGIPASGVLTGQDCCKTQTRSIFSAATRGTSRAFLRPAASTTR